MTSTTSRRSFVSTSMQRARTPNPEVLHTVRIGDTTAFDFYFARGRQGAEISQVSGEPLVIFRGSPGSDTGSYTLQRNGVLITMRNLTTSCADE
ncbi:MAG: hypothetical protein SOI04_07370 [Bifidobacterium thermacidophilum]|uniref:hypothetical protein n=1 Tax=Bifidobacterium thermacidophilum TaxID=246618 RepID=UPI002F356838